MKVESINEKLIAIGKKLQAVDECPQVLLLPFVQAGIIKTEECDQFADLIGNILMVFGKMLTVFSGD